MLNAARQAARKGLTLRRLEIKNQELSFYANNLAMVSGNSAMFSGFALDLLMAGEGNVPENTPHTLAVTAMLTCWSVALGCNLSSLVTGTFASMLGPGLALRGGGDAVTRAVFGVRIEHVWTLCFHLMGLFAFVMGLTIMSCLRLRGSQPIVLTSVFGFAFVLGVFRIYSMKTTLAVDKDKVEAAELEQMEQMGLMQADFEHAETDTLMKAEGGAAEQKETGTQAVEAEAGGAAKSERKSLSSRMSLKNS
jgi:hypothetical protein